MPKFLNHFEILSEYFSYGDILISNNSIAVQKLIVLSPYCIMCAILSCGAHSQCGILSTRKRILLLKSDVTRHVHVICNEQVQKIQRAGFS